MSILDWFKPSKNTANDFKYEFAPADEVDLLASYSKFICTSVAEQQPGFSLDGASVKLLSDSLTRDRANYAGDQKVKIANLYGAYLGHAIMAANPDLNGRWIKTKDNVGILFEFKGQIRIAFPITRVFKHIEDGAEFAMYEYFMAIREVVTTITPDTH